VGAQAKDSLTAMQSSECGRSIRGCFDANRQRLEVAIVYHPDVRPSGEGAIEFFAGVHFHQRSIPISRRCDEIAEKRIFQSGHDEEKLSASLARVSQTCHGSK